MENKPLRRTLSLSKVGYYSTHLHVINPFLPVKMTPGEIRILSWFMALEGDIIKDRFCTLARRMIREELDMTFGGLGNFLKSLGDKGFLIKDIDGKLIIDRRLNAGDEEQIYNFKLIKANDIHSEGTNQRVLGEQEGTVSE